MYLVLHLKSHSYFFYDMGLHFELPCRALEASDILAFNYAFMCA